MKRYIITFFAITLFLDVAAQTNEHFNAGGHVNTGAAFLGIPADIRSIGMGETGISLPGDAFALFNNPARLSFLEEELGGIAIGYKPIASSLTKGIKNLSLSGYGYIGTNEYFGLSLQYFTLGDAHFYDEQANETQFLIPNEFALGGSYIKKLSDNFGMGITFKGIFSNVTGGVDMNGTPAKNAFAIAADIGIMGKIESGENFIGYGASIVNLGSKLTYYDGQQKTYLPTELKFGTSYNISVMDDSFVSLNLDFSKPLVPSRPIRDSEGKIIKGLDPDRSTVGALFTSFSDSPDGIKGELKEFGIATGAEFNLQNKVFIRTGVNLKPEFAGRNSYASFGLGFKTNMDGKILGIQTGYQMPITQNNFIKNSFNIGISISFLDH